MSTKSPWGAGTLQSSRDSAFGRKPQSLNKICVLSTLWSRSCLCPREQGEPAALWELEQVLGRVRWLQTQLTQLCCRAVAALKCDVGVHSAQSHRKVLVAKAEFLQIPSPTRCGNLRDKDTNWSFVSQGELLWKKLLKGLCCAFLAGWVKPGFALSLLHLCSRAVGAAPQGDAAVLRNLESRSKDLKEEREALGRDRTHLQTSEGWI